MLEKRGVHSSEPNANGTCLCCWWCHSHSVCKFERERERELILRERIIEVGDRLMFIWKNKMLSLLVYNIWAIKKAGI